MLGGKQPQGYTIVEVMMFLMITGVLLATSFTLFSGRTDRERLRTGVNEFDANLNTIINQISTGNYTKFNNWSCTAPVNGNPVTWTSGVSTNQGANTGCVFLGEVIHPFQTGDYNTYTIVGRRNVRDTASQEVQSLSQAMPTLAIDNSSGAAEPDIYSGYKLPNGLVVKALIHTSKTGITKNIDAFAFISTLGKYSGAGNDLVSSSQSVLVLPICSSYTDPNTDCNGPGSQVMATNDSSSRTSIANRFPGVLSENLWNPQKIVVCIARSASIPSQAAIVIGEDSSKLTTRVELNNVTTPVASGGLGCP